jgi:D-3-phosphoglycerate dehydrogenase / 2-oxoglutarate reductase
MKPLSSCRVLVTPTSFGKGDPSIKQDLEQAVGAVVYNPTGKPLKSAQLAKLLRGCDGLIAGLDEIDRSALAFCPELRVISRYGVGIDNVDLNAAAEQGIVVTNTPGANSASVAELTVALILALARNIVEASTATRAGAWPRLNGVSLEGKCVGLVGFGAIGKQVARRLAGFDCQLVAFDPYPDHAAAEKYGVQILSLDALLRMADFVSLHLPLLPETQGFVNQDFFLKIKAGSYLVNTSRGELIDENALYAALQTGRLRGAALDVFTVEPPDRSNPLLNLPQVIATPHCASHTDGSISNMGRMALEECLAVLRGEQPRYQVNKVSIGG